MVCGVRGFLRDLALGVMIWLIALVVAVACGGRVLYMGRRIHYSLGDERTLRQQAELVRDWGLSVLRPATKAWSVSPERDSKGPPNRVVYLALAASVMRLMPGRSQRALAWVATVSGCAAVVLGAWLGMVLHGEAGALAGAALVGSSPLVLGMGRRSLADTLELAWQLGAMVALASGAWWGAGVCVALALLSRESTMLLMPALWLFGWLTTGSWWEPVVALAGGLVVHSAVCRALCGMWWWEMRRASRAMAQQTPSLYGARYLSGGVHRLVVDLVMVSPIPVLLALGAFARGSVETEVSVCWVAMACYGFAPVPKQIRQNMAVDVLLRVAVASVVPWWGIAMMVAFDLVLWKRVWWNRELYDPTTLHLAEKLWSRES